MSTSSLVMFTWELQIYLLIFYCQCDDSKLTCSSTIDAIFLVSSPDMYSELNNNNNTLPVKFTGQ